jgi:hypothetical protein
VSAAQPTIAPRILKRWGDLLDAALSAYVAYLAWLPGRPRVEVHGDLANGFIVVPLPRQEASASAGEASSGFTLSDPSDDIPTTQEEEMQETSDERRLCLCGCGGTPKSGRFLPGHDVKLKSALLKRVALGDAAAKDEMRQLGWEQFLPAQTSQAPNRDSAKATAPRVSTPTVT